MTYAGYTAGQLRDIAEKWPTARPPAVQWATVMEWSKVAMEALRPLLDRVEHLENALRRCNCSECDIPACNCGSWHRRPSKADTEHDALLDRVADLEAELARRDEAAKRLVGP